MKRLMEATNSLWMATAQVPPRGSLNKDLSVDVCIVGAGIAGLTTAYLLAKAGLQVAILDSRRIAAGQSQRTSAHLTNAHDDFYSEVEKVHGVEGIRIAAASHTAAIDLIEKITAQHNIDCDFRRVPGYLFLGQDQQQDLLETELAAVERAGLTGVEFVGRAPLVDFNTKRCLRYPHQAQFHPLKYFIGVADQIEKAGGQIFDNCQVKEVKGGSDATITTSAGPTITAKAVVVATNSPMNDMYAIHTKQAPYLTYCIGMPVTKGSISPALYWDTEDPYHYIRTQPFDDQTEILIVGGEDHKAGQVVDQDERHARLEEWARPRFPRAGPVRFRWSGMTMETTDGAAFIGRNPGDQPNVFIATGDSGMGLTHGTIAGMILSDLVQGNKHPWADFYDPSRKPISGMSWKRYVSENANVAQEYLHDYLISDSADATDLSKDCGTVIREGFSQVAVYRDKKGDLHKFSALCPHLGCVVHWNKLEKVWDCPCHGSRFDAMGRVIQAPAISNLKSIAEKDS